MENQTNNSETETNKKQVLDEEARTILERIYKRLQKVSKNATEAIKILNKMKSE